MIRHQRWGPRRWSERVYRLHHPCHRLLTLLTCYLENDVKLFTDVITRTVLDIKPATVDVLKATPPELVFTNLIGGGGGLHDALVSYYYYDFNSFPSLAF